MNKTYKYQRQMDEKGLKELCPFTNCREADIPAYRWGIAPIENPENFLPAFLYNQIRQIPPRANSNNDFESCSTFALSMFTSLETAKNRFNGMFERNKKMLGYTHVLSGNILKSMGVISEINKGGHFDLFEYEGIELRNSFEVVGEFI